MKDNHLNSQAESIWQEDEHVQSLPIMDYLQLLWFRRKLIVAITIFFTVIGYIQVSEIKNVYAATSSLMIGLPKANLVNIKSVYDARDDAGTEMEVLRSQVLAAKVVERLKLYDYPEFNPRLRQPEKSLFEFLKYLKPSNWVPGNWKQAVSEALGNETEQAPVVTPAAPPGSQEQEEKQIIRAKSTATSIFLSRLSLAQVGLGNVINITFSSGDPDMAAMLANELAEAYILDQMESKFEATEKANIWLTQQLADLEVKVVESERAVEIYRDQHGLSANPGSSLLDEQLSELSSQIIIARSEQAEVDARLAQLRRLLDGGGQGVETASEVLSSALIQELRTQEAQALTRASQLAIEYGPKHPRMLQVNAELGEIRERIRVGIEQIIVGLEQEAEFAQAKVNSLDVSLRVTQGETSAQNKEAIRLRTLQREADANRALFDTFLRRFTETSSTQGMETSDARVLSKSEGGQLSYPNRNKMRQKYILFGFFGACALVLGLQFLNPGLMSPEQAQHVLGEHVIGLIPVIAGKLPLHDYVLEKPASSLVEAINSLNFSLELSDPDHPVKAVAVTSSVPEEGKSTLAISLARVVASSGKKVVILDGDMRRSSVGNRLGFQEKHKGLSDLVVAGDVELTEFIQRDEKGKIDYMPPGTAKYANATDIFSSHRMAGIIDQLKARYDLVIIDTPPVMAVADARIIGRVVDKTIFVVRWDKTPRKVARTALEQLRRAEVSLAGIVLQQVDLKRYGRIGYGNSGYYYHYGRYGKYYSS